jgi:BMFP domain-containing protein YqiC
MSASTNRQRLEQMGGIPGSMMGVLVEILTRLDVVERRSFDSRNFIIDNQVDIATLKERMNNLITKLEIIEPKPNLDQGD